MDKKEPFVTAEQVRDFFAQHRSIRHYQTTEEGKPISIPTEHLDAILYAAQRASTDATAQLYSIIRVTNENLRENLAAWSDNAHLCTASEVFVICADVARLEQFLTLGGYEMGEWRAIGLHFGLGDAVMAGSQLLVAAEMLGYGGCWVGGVLHEMPLICEQLALPAGVLPFAALTIGIPAEQPPQRPRLPRDLVVHENSYRSASSEELGLASEQMNPIAVRHEGEQGDWIRLLNGYFGKGRIMEKREDIMKKALEQQNMG